MKKLFKLLLIPGIVIGLIIIIKKHCSNGNCEQGFNVRKKLMGFLFNKIAQKLELTCEQCDKIKAIFSEIY